MDGKVAWRDNVFLERLWRSVKYERFYLRANGALKEVKVDMARCINSYNRERVHSSMEDRSPEQACSLYQFNPHAVSLSRSVNQFR
jgi:putative transposase